MKAVPSRARSTLSRGGTIQPHPARSTCDSERAAQRMAGAGDHRVRLVGQALEFQLIAQLGIHDPPHHDVQLAIEQARDQRPAVVHLHPHQDAGEGALDPRHRQRHQVGARVDHRAQRRLAQPALAQRGDLIAGVGQLGQRRPRVARQHLAVAGRFDAARVALEQGHAQQALHLGQQLGGGRLGHPRRLGGAQDRALLVQVLQEQQVARLQQHGPAPFSTGVDDADGGGP